MTRERDTMIICWKANCAYLFVNVQMYVGKNGEKHDVKEYCFEHARVEPT